MSVAPAPAPAAGSPRIRVMVVDDSVVIRGLVSRWVTEAGGFDVVATASNGKAAVEALDRCEPDIVLLDLEMPVMDGLAALPQILKRRPGAKVVVISTLTQRNAEISLKCLSLGAVDYLPKPDGHRQVTTSAEFRRELVGKLAALSGARARPPRPPLRVAAAPRPATRLGLARPRCLLIGASTGGPRAVEEVLTGLGSGLQRLPTLIVQHMPPMFTGVFAERLRTQIGLRACEPEDGEPLVAGTVYVAPGGRHMGLSVGLGEPVIRLDDGPPVNFCRPAVDVLFRDAAPIFGAAALAVVLTGMGSDGTEGARALAQAGGTVLAQDEATSTIWGMPGSVVKAGLAQDVLPLEAIGPALRGHITGSVS
jgi:two-component system, chemotaxis family, protein-glutamate methylesterase/glutaminase